MQLNRSLLYSGVFLVAIGGVLLATDLGAVEPASYAGVLRAWPVAIIAVGAGLVLRRTPIGVPAGVLAAAMPGLLLGGAFAAIPHFVGTCASDGEPATVATESGTFDAPATVSIETSCGDLHLATGVGNTWQLLARNTQGRGPTVNASAGSLSIEPTDSRGWNFFTDGRSSWDLTLPSADIQSLSVVTHANHSDLRLPGASIGRLALTANASEVTVDATDASIGSLSAVVNVGQLSIHLPARADMTGSLRVGAGAIQLCAPPGLGIRVTSQGFEDQVSVNGLRQTGSEWQSLDYPTAAHRADITVAASFGDIEINPTGGCT